MNELMHHGIEGQKWGDQNGPPYPLSAQQKSAEERRLERADKKWARRNSEKIRKQTERSVSKETKEFKRALDQYYGKSKYTARGKIRASYATTYSKYLAELMNKNVAEIKSPSGKVVQFVAKRGEMGVYVALADPGYDLSQLRNGVYGSGKVAYRSEQVEKLDV